MARKSTSYRHRNQNTDSQTRKRRYLRRQNRTLGMPVTEGTKYQRRITT